MFGPPLIGITLTLLAGHQQTKDHAMKKTLFLASLALASQITSAESEGGQYNYASVGYMAFGLDIEAEGVGISADLGAITAAFGHRFNQWASVEARIGVGIQDDTWSGQGNGLTADVTYDLKSILGVYGKLHFFHDAPISPYGMIGYTTGKVDNKLTISDGFTTESAQADTSENDLSFGIGVDACGEQMCGNLEFARLFDEDDFSVDAITASVVFKF